MRIGIDLMGGDNPPQLLFDAIIAALKQYSPLYTFVLFAVQDVVDELHKKFHSTLSHKDTARVEFHVIDDFIAMSDDPLLALRSKKGASILVAMRLLKHGHLDALVSIGNTGALIAAASLILPPLPGIKRPALLATLPSGSGKVAVIDIGGNISWKSHHLVQFARMGAVYQRCLGEIVCPTVGLLNIGVESKKGTKELREAYSSLAALKHQRLKFVGNIEARDVLEGRADVVVTDGFTGNILLKAMEGAVCFMLHSLKKDVKGIKQLTSKFDYMEYPGALVCGVEGIVVKCHGNATARTLYHSIVEVIRLVETKLVKKLKHQLLS